MIAERRLRAEPRSPPTLEQARSFPGVDGLGRIRYRMGDGPR
jgi:hypothetical protein